METKKELPIEIFVNKVETLSTEMIDDNKSNGYILFAYEEVGFQLASAFSCKGRINCLAECLCSCMKQNPMLANVVISAANAIVQSRIVESQILAEAKEQKSNKKNNKKKLS